MRFKVGGCEVRVTFLFAAAMTLMMLEDTGGMVCVTVLCACLHEFGHLAAMAFWGSRPEKLTFGLFGMELTQGERQLGYRQEIFTALAGPAVSLLLFLLLWGLGFCLDRDSLLVAAVINLSLAGFNLLPISSLDGGRALFYALCERVAEEKAEKIGTALSAAVLLPVAAAGFTVMLRSGYNISLLLAAVYLSALLILKSSPPAAETRRKRVRKARGRPGSA